VLFGLEIDSEVLSILQRPVALPATFNPSFNHSSLLDRFPEDMDFYCRKVLGMQNESHQCSR